MNIKIQNLRFGHEPGAPLGVVNVRVTGREAGLDALGASILALGLIQPLVVVPGEGELAYVVDGNRRLAALRALVADGKMAADAEVPVTVREAAFAREIGLGANVNQSPMHPADQVEAFATLRRTGATEKVISQRFGMKVPQVRKLLALGGVSHAVLDAWRNEKLRIEDVQTFTLASHADQDRVVAKVLKEGNAWSIRRELGLDANVAHLLNYVGAKAYKNAGGVIVEDLFGSRDAVSDPTLLKRLADERLEAECERRRKEGWLWVETEANVPDEARWSWPKLQPETRALSPEDQARYDELQSWLDSDDDDATDEAIRVAHDEVAKLEASQSVPLGMEARAKSGCILSISHDGKVFAREFIVRPGDVPEKKESTAKAEPEEKGLTDALVGRLSEQATRAVQAALPSSPKAGLAILLAGALCESRGTGPMHVTLGGLGGAEASVKQKQTFDTVLAGLLDRSVDELLQVAAFVAARGVSLSHYGQAAPSSRPSVMALMGAIDPAALTTALDDAFDGEGFFKAIPKAMILGIVGEVLGEAEARRVKDFKKGELAAFAVGSVLPTGWLPAEIRHPGYAGPGAVGVEPAPQALAA